MNLKRIAAAATLTVVSVSSSWAVSVPLTFVGDTASFSANVSGVFSDMWTFDVVAPGANAAAAATNISVFGSGNIADFVGTLASVPLASSTTTSFPVVVNLLSGFAGFLAPGSYNLTIGGNAGSGASYGGNVVLTPIPEPETYALMLAGLGIVGFVAARRRPRV